MQKKQGEKQTHEFNARSSPGKVQDCRPEVYLHRGTSFFFCCLESGKRHKHFSFESTLLSLSHLSDKQCVICPSYAQLDQHPT